MSHLLHRPAIVLAALLASALPSSAQSTSPCADRTTTCADVGSFVATVTDFRTSTQSYYKVATVTVRIENRSTRPLRLAYLAGSGVATDDQGNRYVVTGNNAVRGIGQASGNQVDPKFALAPGESSDARFELMWRPARTTDLVGTVFDVDLALREVELLQANQVRLGREHALSFRELRSGTVAVAAVSAPAPTTSSGTVEQPPATEPKPRGIIGVLKAAAKAKQALEQAGNAEASAGAEKPNTTTDACGGSAQCHDAGPFTIEVVQITGSRIGGSTNDHVLRLALKVRNTSTDRLVLAYTARSSLAMDELGNRYYSARPGTHDVSAKGIGVAAGNRIDPQFTLDPGQSRMVTFDVRRFNTGRTSALGTRFTHELALEQLELLNGGAVRSTRQHAVMLRDLTIGSR